MQTVTANLAPGNPVGSCPPRGFVSRDVSRDIPPATRWEDEGDGWFTPAGWPAPIPADDDAPADAEPTGPDLSDDEWAARNLFDLAGPNPGWIVGEPDPTDIALFTMSAMDRFFDEIAADRDAEDAYLAAW